jgi:hypothetical protein
MELIGAEELGRRLQKSRNCIYSETSQGKWKGYCLRLGRKRLYDWDAVEPFLRSLIQAELSKVEEQPPQPVQPDPPPAGIAQPVATSTPSGQPQAMGEAIRAE